MVLPDTTIPVSMAADSRQGQVYNSAHYPPPLGASLQSGRRGGSSPPRLCLVISAPHLTPRRGSLLLAWQVWAVHTPANGPGPREAQTHPSGWLSRPTAPAVLSPAITTPSGGTKKFWIDPNTERHRHGSSGVGSHSTPSEKTNS
ncbi:hypothetical protein E2C01_002696 [Portunus trituberculatus]|uniref:Uncharacterized protein n=1 Tax=Portunus trituberculatus TaxID=210409 RepID=A0A5B7CKL4_PORTR|nr:hypothetical protein [Portunus trituberculatus]